MFIMVLSNENCFQLVIHLGKLQGTKLHIHLLPNTVLGRAAKKSPKDGWKFLCNNDKPTFTVKWVFLHSLVWFLYLFSYLQLC